MLPSSCFTLVFNIHENKVAGTVTTHLKHEKCNYLEYYLLTKM